MRMSRNYDYKPDRTTAETSSKTISTENVATDLKREMKCGAARRRYPTRTFRSILGQDSGTDDRFARATADGFGAFILGRNMFGPAGDDWGGPDWKGWWGDNPPYHAPTFVLTHHARAPILMEGGTTFYFVTDGIESALAQAKVAAGDLDVMIGGGVSTVRQYLLAGAIDEMHLAMSPTFLGRGESLFAGIDLPSLGYRVTEVVPTELVTHLVLTR